MIKWDYPSDVKSDQKIYTAIRDMHRRCYDEKYHAYHHYGKRGIIVEDEWNWFVLSRIEVYIKFYRWSMNNGYASRLQLDRINTDGNYSSSNCRWTTKNVQEINKRRAGKKSNFIGVYSERKTSRWFALYVNKQGKDIRIGTFDSDVEAAKAYDKAIERVFKGSKLSNRKLFGDLDLITPTIITTPRK